MKRGHPGISFTSVADSQNFVVNSHLIHSSHMSRQTETTGLDNGGKWMVLVHLTDGVVAEVIMLTMNPSAAFTQCRAVTFLSSVSCGISMSGGAVNSSRSVSRRHKSITSTLTSRCTCCWNWWICFNNSCTHTVKPRYQWKTELYYDTNMINTLYIYLTTVSCQNVCYVFYTNNSSN